MAAFLQFYVTFVCSLGILLNGFGMVWPSYTIPRLNNPDESILEAALSTHQEGLIGSLPLASGTLGIFITALTVNNLQRRHFAMTIATWLFIGWLLILFSNRIVIILLGRFIAGVPLGSLFVFVNIYVTEVADEKWRAVLIGSTVMSQNIGNLLSYTAGCLLSYFHVCYMALALSMIMLFSAYCAKFLEAEDEKNNLKQEVELEVTEVFINKNGKCGNNDLNFKLAAPSILKSEEKSEDQSSLLSEWKSFVTSRENHKPLAVCVGIIIMQVLMGFGSVEVYAGKVFRQVAPEVSSDFVSILLGLAVISAELIYLTLTNSMGRKALLLMSVGTCSAAMLSLAVLVQLRFGSPWLKVAAILLFCFSFGLGAAIVPLTLVTDLFVPRLQGMASVISAGFFYATIFISLQVFPWLTTSAIGIHGVFYMYGATGLLYILVICLIMPDTRYLKAKQIHNQYHCNANI